ncbi:MAG: laccase domain-containing protein [Microthrixaceae bacterium]
MPVVLDVPLPGGSVAQLSFTGAADGDLRVDGPTAGLEARRRAVAPGPWTWLRQVHGARVVTVTRPGEWAGEEADAAVTDVPGAVLAAHTADCAGVLLCSSGDGDAAVVGAAHAGWRGLAGGVLQSAVRAMEDLGARRVSWWLGPCISAPAYEFGEDDLDALSDRYGPELRARTGDGGPALDLRAGVAAALAEVGAVPGDADGPPPCTALDPGWYSWRARADRGRQAAVIRILPDPGGEDPA